MLPPGNTPGRLHRELDARWSPEPALYKRPPPLPYFPSPAAIELSVPCTRLQMRPAMHLTRVLTRRTHTAAAQAAARQLLSNPPSPLTRHETLDGTQLAKLAATLSRPVPPPRSSIPAGHHLVYFTPSAPEAELGADGSDRTFNAPAPFSRRMWAGGRMTWHPEAGGLRVGEPVEERTRLCDAVAKTGRAAGDMVRVDVEKQFWGPRGLAVTDVRSWVFRRPAEGSGAVPPPVEGVTEGPSMVEDLPADKSGFPVRRLRWSPVGLFRFSALTFNAHMIHYSESWTRDVERHGAVVVHGPLNLVCLLDYWRDVHGSSPRAVSYRATAPVYAGQTYCIRTGDVKDGVYEILVERDGVVCMRAEVEA